MVFTKQDILEIAKKLRLVSIKDSEFEEVQTLQDTDKVSILRQMPDETYSNYRTNLNTIASYIHPINVVQSTGDSTEAVMSQKAVTDALSKIPKIELEQTTGTAEDKAMSQKAVTDALSKIPKIELEQTTGTAEDKAMSQKATTEALEEKVSSTTIQGVEIVNGTAPEIQDNILYIELTETY